MSIMDHDPKYAKLRAWREQRQLRLASERRAYWFSLIPRKRFEGEVYPFKSIFSFEETAHEP